MTQKGNAQVGMGLWLCLVWDLVLDIVVVRKRCQVVLKTAQEDCQLLTCTATMTAHALLPKLESTTLSHAYNICIAVSNNLNRLPMAWYGVQHFDSLSNMIFNTICEKQGSAA